MNLHNYIIGDESKQYEVFIKDEEIVEIYSYTLGRNLSPEELDEVNKTKKLEGLVLELKSNVND